MVDIIIKKMTDTVENEKGCISPLFGFAVNDYKAEYDLSNNDLIGKKIFGGILNKDDQNKDIMNILNVVIEANYDMIIIDHNEATDSQKKTINYFFDNNDDYVELKDTYQDRFVFVKIPNK